MTNLEWIRSGKTGCTFATLFAKAPEAIGWKFYTHHEFMVMNLFQVIDALLVSITFPEGWTIEDVRLWSFKCGFYEEYTSKDTVGLRIDCPEGKAWVQYFGPDSHVKTRQAPYPMLMYTRKLNKSYYVKMGFNGFLHLAHAWTESITDKVYDLLWRRSYDQTRKLLGKSPTIKEAAKSTWIRRNY